jgi:hypothetical protein
MAAIVGPFLLASGIFNPNGNPDFVWTGDGGQGLSRWELNKSQLELTTTSIQPLWSVDQWTIYGAAHFINNAFGPTSPASQNPSTSQMLMKNANGTMTLQWFDAQGNYTGRLITDLTYPDATKNLAWTGINYLAAGPFRVSAKQAGLTDFLVSDGNNHLLDYAINESNNTVFKIDLSLSGQSWSQKEFLVAGNFLNNTGVNSFVVTSKDQILTWFINDSNQLSGFDTTPAGDSWTNKQLITIGTFDNRAPTGRAEILFFDQSNHIRELWVDPTTAKFTGVDTSALPGGKLWQNKALLAVGRFDENSANTELLVRDTQNGHMLEWWFTPDGIGEVDLTVTSGVGTGIQIVSTGNYFGSAFDDLLVRDTTNGNFYFWGTLVTQPGVPSSTPPELSVFP